MEVQPAECGRTAWGSLANEAANAVLVGDHIESPMMGPAGSPKLVVHEIAGSPGSSTVVPGASMTEYRAAGADSFLLPIAPRRQIRRPSRCLEMPASSPKCGEASPEKVRRKPRRLLSLKTPSSCTSPGFLCDRTPCSPDPVRDDLRIIEGNVQAIMMDFDGTLTATGGEAAMRSRKQAELQSRAPMLRPRLQQLRDAGMLLGIISKSSELTIRCAIRESGLSDLFDGPIVAKAVGFEGKAGFIADLVEAGTLGDLGPDGLTRVLLIDDDVRELDRAVKRGIQTYAAPPEGGLQDEDFDEIMACLGLEPDTHQSPPAQAMASTAEAWPEPEVGAADQSPGWTWLRPDWCRKRGGG